jgi:SAM-dependent methyltransferase
MGLGLRKRALEGYYLFAAAAAAADAKVDATLENVEATRERIRRLTGLELRGLRVLDIGPGQQLRHMRCFAMHNDVCGIDMDVIPQAFRVADYAQMLQRNSAVRALKTVTRKALGVDRRFASALCRRIGARSVAPLDVRRMDAAAMTFQDASFDCVYSYSVFEHIDRPRAAIEEIRRVLVPGGVAYVSIHLYTSHSGQHDPRMLLQEHPAPPYWPHLRARFRHAVSPSAYLNELRLAEWRATFEAVMPGVVFEAERHDELRVPLRQLRSEGELAQYDDDELLTLNLIAIWQKPAVVADALPALTA